MAKKYLSLERLTEYDELLKAEIVEGDASVKSYVDAEVAKKANSSHTHDDRYYTETEVDTKLSTINTSISNITNGTTKVAEAEHADSADSATTAASATKATQDGNGKVISSTYETKTDASAKLTEAKTYADTAANKVKNDLLNGAGDAYDTLKELGDLIDVNVDAIEALETVAAGKADKVHSHDDRYYTETEVDTKLETKANTSHAHAIADITNLQTTLDGKANASHGTHVTFNSTNKPKMDGTAAFGTATTVARSDHVHPTDTSRASKTEFDTHVSDTTKHITSTERTNWGAAYTHSQAAHAPSNAEKNQNAFSNVKVGSTTIAADTTTDTLTLVAGTNVTITPDATGDSITISATDTKVTVDSALSSSSTNPVQNKIVNSAISTLTSTVSTNTSSINSHTTAISNLQTAVSEIQEITSEEISALFA